MGVLSLAVAGGIVDVAQPGKLDELRATVNTIWRDVYTRINAPEALDTDATPAAEDIYGTGIGFDTKANIPIGPNGQKMAIRFEASTTSKLDSVRWVQRGGPGYSRGNGGTTTVSVRADDGAGHPSHRILASEAMTTDNPGGDWEKYDPAIFRKPPTLAAGKTYYVEFTNPSTENNISVNNVYAYNATKPRQPIFSDDKFGVMMSTSGSWGELEKGYTPVVDLAYADGTHDGQAYYEAMVDKFAVISGANNMVRERFKVSGGDKAVGSVALRVRRSDGTSPLTLTLEKRGITFDTAGGTVIESVTVPAVDVPISVPGGDNGGAVWATAKFAEPHVLKNGSTYDLRVSTGDGTTFTTFSVRPATPKGFGSYAFSGGTGQFTTDGKKWADIYQWDHQDLQFYFTKTPNAVLNKRP